MGNLIVAGVLSAFAVLVASADSAAADPQMLGIVETASPVPLHCANGECGAELSAICLQEERATPTFGYRYVAHDRQTIELIGIGRDGSRVALAVENALRFAAARGYSAVRVSVHQDVLREHDIARVEVTIGEGLTLIPETKSREPPRRLTAPDIDQGAGELRQTAIAIVDRDTDKGHASQLLARMIDRLPKRGRAGLDQRTGLWAAAGAPFAAKLSKRGAHRARTVYNGCYRETRLGDSTLRECLAQRHDALMRDLNEDYWAAVRAGA